MKHYVFNLRTGRMVGSYSTRRPAQRLADRLDLEYGAINSALFYGTLEDATRWINKIRVNWAAKLNL